MAPSCWVGGSQHFVPHGRGVYLEHINVVGRPSKRLRLVTEVDLLDGHFAAAGRPRAISRREAVVRVPEEGWKVDTLVV